MQIRQIIQLARPKHWIKNAVVFIPVVFAKRTGDIEAWAQAGMAALAFCFASAFAYIVNDIKDRRADLAHPLKKDRPTLIAYTPELLRHLITLSAGIAVISFLLYGLSDSTLSRFGSIYFVYTLPIVVYGVFRFAMLSRKGSYADPTDIFFNDRPFQATALLRVAAAFGIIILRREPRRLAAEPLLTAFTGSSQKK
ncbi:MAG: UbiA prenyltransferase family protein [Planctomycetota bacterium]|jgi:4-hydroxybenzoate polyprenyltransferase